MTAVTINISPLLSGVVSGVGKMGSTTESINYPGAAGPFLTTGRPAPTPS